MFTLLKQRSTQIYYTLELRSNNLQVEQKIYLARRDMTKKKTWSKMTNHHSVKSDRSINDRELCRQLSNSQKWAKMTISDFEKFQFRWLENSAIEMGKSTVFLIFNLLN